MAQQIEKGLSDLSLAIHQYYMDIINCMPNIVYWVDLNCDLKGSNNNFVKLLNLDDLHDFNGTPYELMHKFAHWPAKQVEALKLDDMAVIFSGKAKYNVEISSQYLATRVPLFDKQKQVSGLVVILTEHMEHEKHFLVNQVKAKKVKRAKDKVPYILMVEDNVIAQKVEQALLISIGCKVDIAESGEAALSLFTPGKYDIVFMDIGLQDTSGYIVSKKLREKEKDTAHHVPIIALTSYKAAVVKQDCRDYFMDGVITKPLTGEQAEQIIQHYVYQQDIQVNGLESL